jgi:hypothetical protein
MDKKFDMMGLARIVMLGVGVAVLVGGSTRSALAEDDETSEGWDQKVYRHIMTGIGLRDGSPGLTYRERSPLVVPPSRDLPPPESATMNSNPAWPRDPDQTRAAVAKPKRAITGREQQLANDSGTALLPGELNTGRTAGSGGPQRNLPVGDPLGRPLPPSALEQKSIFNVLGFGSAKKEPPSFTSEPPRATLTDPPVGYQTPSPSQPYSNREERWLPRVPNFWDRAVGGL